VNNEPMPNDVAPPPAAAAEGFPKPGLWLSFLSFLPPFNVVALLWGIAALKRRTRFSVRALLAFCLGGFFTVLYVLGIAGWLLPRGAPPARVGLEFLAEADPSLEQPIALLGAGRPFKAEAQLEALAAAQRGWAVHCALGVVESHLGDWHGAAASFQNGLAENPDRGEFYYFYGVVLLNLRAFDEAAESFRRALQYEPRIDAAEPLLALAQNTYQPSRVTSIVWSVVALVVLIVLHEYAHGYAAWKLGDDTAKERGRLSLNPLAHIDLFGSLILPAILIWRQSPVVFAWAKPVPVNPQNFRDPRRDQMVVSFAGPAVNLGIAMACFLLVVLIAFVLRMLSPGAYSMSLATPFSAVAVAGTDAGPYVVQPIAFLKQLMFISLVLGCLNLIPVPPLDGSWILSGILPRSIQFLFEKLRPYGLIIFILLVISPALDILLFIPAAIAWLALYLPLAAMGFG